VNALFGVVRETEISPGINSDDSIPSIPTSWIFIVRRRKLAIELDGSGRGYLLRETRDHARDEFLASMGITVLRFWNHQVREEFDSVLKAIWFALEERCPKNPSPSSSPFTKGEAPQKRRGVIRSRFTDRESDSCEIQRDIAL
jgi:Protein of unknown function (DUF559)